MTCEELLQAMNEYVDGTLDLGVCEKFSAHLADCNPCQVVVDNIRKTIALYRDGEPYPLPEEFERHLKQNLRERFRAKFPSATE